MDDHSCRSRLSAVGGPTASLTFVITIVCAAVLVAAALCVPSGARAADPAWVAQTSGTTAALYDIFFIDAERGWVVGDNGTILRTTNGGQTWTKQTSGTTTDLHQVEFVDQNNGWVLGGLPPASPIALKTTNGGATWTRVNLPPNLGGNPVGEGGYLDISVVDASAVWIGGRYGTIIRTLDGGATWDRQDRLSAGGSLSVVNAVYGIHFRDRTNGCVVGLGYLRHHTTNGGATWSPSALTGTSLGAGTTSYYSLTFLTPLEGWVRVNSVEGTTVRNGILHTTDGGVTWQLVPAVTEQEVYCLSFATSNAGWGVYEEVLLRTQDGGRTWTPQARPGSEVLQCVFFLPATRTGGTPRGWAVGESGTILAYGGGGGTTPGGQCFSDVPPAHSYYTPVQGLCEAGVIDGYAVPGGKEFRPQNNLFRAQFAKMILGVLKIAVTENDWIDASRPFTDFDKDDPANLYPHDFVAKAFALGITKGKTATTFAPYIDVTRAQMITMVVRAATNFKAGALATPPAGWSGGRLTSYYTNPDHGANVRTAEYNGLLDGIAGLSTNWNCEGKASRGEAAQIMWNLYRLEAGTTPGPQVLFSDDFSSKAGGWPQTGTADYMLAYDTTNARYTINVVAPYWLAWASLATSYTDVTAEVRAACLSTGKEGFYGLIFRATADNKDMYQFLVSNQGYWQLWRVAGGTRTALTDVRDNPSSAIKKGTEWNTLKAVAKSGDITFHINSTKVCDFPKAVLTSGRVGLAGGTAATGNVQLGFDDYKISTTP